MREELLKGPCPICKRKDVPLYKTSGKLQPHKRTNIVGRIVRCSGSRGRPGRWCVPCNRIVDPCEPCQHLQLEDALSGP